MKHQRPIYQIKEDFLKKLTKYKVSQAVNQLKNEYNYNELLFALPEVMKIGSPFKKLIWGNLFPKSYSELGVGNNYYYRSEGVVNELNWILIQVAKHKHQINEFVLTRDAIFCYLTLGDYERAEYEIRKLEEGLGVSVWSTEMKLLSYSLSGREVQSFELLSIINQAAEDCHIFFSKDPQPNLHQVMKMSYWLLISAIETIFKLIDLSIINSVLIIMRLRIDLVLIAY